MNPEVLLERIEVAEAALERINAEEQQALTNPEKKAIDVAMTALAVAYDRIRNYLDEVSS